MYWKAVARLYNHRVQSWPVRDDDLVLRKAKVNDLGHTRGKLAPRWEAPYRVIRTIRDDTYVWPQWMVKCFPEHDTFRT
ncbi:hypothetical protein BHE74_00041118 [Ensete ventricosum]|nr:hypothetical protein BHE74_00041118 [Ensete ventricosum]